MFNNNQSEQSMIDVNILKNGGSVGANLTMEEMDTVNGGVAPVPPLVYYGSAILAGLAVAGLYFLVKAGCDAAQEAYQNLDYLNGGRDGGV